MGAVPLNSKIRNFTRRPIEDQSMRTIDPGTRNCSEALKEAMDLAVRIR
jgi:hypothetical protein